MLMCLNVDKSLQSCLSMCWKDTRSPKPVTVGCQCIGFGWRSLFWHLMFKSLNFYFFLFVISSRKWKRCNTDTGFTYKPKTNAIIQLKSYCNDNETMLMSAGCLCSLLHKQLPASSQMQKEWWILGRAGLWLAATCSFLQLWNVILGAAVTLTQPATEGGRHPGRLWMAEIKDDSCINRQKVMSSNLTLWVFVSLAYSLILGIRLMEA